MVTWRKDFVRKPLRRRIATYKTQKAITMTLLCRLQTPQGQLDDDFKSQATDLEAARMPLGLRSLFILIFRRLLLPSRLPAGVMRLEWTCRCGYASYDDFNRASWSQQQPLRMSFKQSKILRALRITTEQQSLLSQLLVSIWNAIVSGPFRQARNN